jgi:hypothetical protein
MSGKGSTDWISSTPARHFDRPSRASPASFSAPWMLGIASLARGVSGSQGRVVLAILTCKAEGGCRVVIQKAAPKGAAVCTLPCGGRKKETRSMRSQQLSPSSAIEMSLQATEEAARHAAVNALSSGELPAEVAALSTELYRLAWVCFCLLEAARRSTNDSEYARVRDILLPRGLGHVGCGHRDQAGHLRIVGESLSPRDHEVLRRIPVGDSSMEHVVRRLLAVSLRLGQMQSPRV